jgi:peptidoglycan-associated lipoprotein
MRNPRLGILFFLISLITQPLLAQSETEPELPKELKEAYEAFDSKEFFYAVELLKDAYTEVRGRDAKAEVLFKTAEAYRMMNDYRNAENYYNKAVKVGYEDPIALLQQGNMLKAQGDYEEAIEIYQQFKKDYPTDSRADEAIESTRMAIKWKNEPSQYQVDNMKDLNSREMDFAVTYGGDRRDNNVLIFVSNREESTGNDEDGWTGGSFFDIYTTQAERKGRSRRRGNDDEEEVSYADLKWSTPVPLDEEGILNTENHEGVAVFDSRKKELYFTKCIKEKNEKLGCGIWVTEEVGQSWREAEPVIIGQDTSANVGHPALSADDKILYFVSDDFGASKHDIFMTTYDRRAKAWAKPTNLGAAVNTDGEEYYPVVHGDGYLYFASDGHPGMGGLDVFRIKLGEDGMPEGKAENMKFPINSNFDDFHLIWEPGDDTKKGFVSSNREGGQGSDDLFAVYRTPLVFNLEGVILSSKTKQPIPNATVSLEGSDGSSFSITADEDGYYIFDDTKIKADVTYNLNFQKEKFLTNTGDVSTVGIELESFEYIPSANYFIKRLKLNKELDPIEEPIVLPNVFFDLGKWDLRPEAMAALDSVVTILNNNPRIVIELRSHTDYRDSERRNQVLSQKRADTCVRYLISKDIDSARLVSKGMGESDPFKIPENYEGYGAGQFEQGQVLTERFIKSLAPETQEVANQINRRTDFKVLRDDYVPAEGLKEVEGVDARDIISDKREEEQAPGEIYVLKKRESFGIIARKFNINMVELKRLNGGLRGVRPFIGLQLKVEKDGNYEDFDATHYQVLRRGESLKDIAKKLDVDKDLLEQLNPNLEEVEIQPGLWIKYKK